MPPKRGAAAAAAADKGGKGAKKGKGAAAAASAAAAQPAGKKHAGVIVLFDVDGTLTAPRKEADPTMLEFLTT